ncbi:MAG TPA: DUF3261 domain-containing protein [Pseudobdellovibrionaceae bacterium]|nr:DUF3261 domain-containing protein [Pseudobdellovibrionaceae bacterium]
MRFLTALMFLSLAACASTPQTRSVSEADLLFPSAKYQQQVSVLITAPGQERDFDFSAVVRKVPDEMLFAGYSPFGFTLFTITEREGQLVQMDSSVEPILKNKEFFLKVFSLVKAILSVQKSDPRLQDNGISLTVEGLKARVEFSEYDPAGVPLQIDVGTAGQYQVKIRTESYKLMSR